MNLIFLVAATVLGAVANRLRGTKGVLVAVPAVLVAAMAWTQGATLPFLSLPGGTGAFALIVAAFILGENWGWTRWIWGAKGVYDKGLDTGITNGSLWITRLFANEDNKPWFHQFGMFVRGLYWWVPVYASLWFTGVVQPVPAVVATVVTSLMFYVTYRLGFWISEKKDTQYLITSEYLYGAVYFLILALAMVA